MRNRHESWHLTCIILHSSAAASNVQFWIGNIPLWMHHMLRAFFPVLSARAKLQQTQNEFTHAWQRQTVTKSAWRTPSNGENDIFLSKSSATVLTIKTNFNWKKKLRRHECCASCNNAKREIIMNWRRRSVNHLDAFLTEYNNNNSLLACSECSSLN